MRRGRIGRSKQRPYRLGSAICLFLTGVPTLPLLAGMSSERQGAALRAPAPNSSAGTVSGFTRYVSPSSGSWELGSADGNKVSVKSLLKVDGRMKYGDFIWNDEGVPPGKMWVRVDLKRQTLSVFRNGHEIGTSVILYGVDGRSTPAGDFKILEKDRDHWSRTYIAPMPYSLMLTHDGVAIHGSDVRSGFGTHGCVGVPIAFARRIFESAQVGDMVSIVTT